MKIELSAKALVNRYRLQIFGERVIYSSDDGAFQDATNDRVLFTAYFVWGCEAGCAIEVGGELRFSDGVREDLPVGEIGPYEYVDFLRVSETEYSLRAGYRRTGYRYYLLDVANWTCRRV